MTSVKESLLKTGLTVPQLLILGPLISITLISPLFFGDVFKSIGDNMRGVGIIFGLQNVVSTDYMREQCLMLRSASTYNESIDIANRIKYKAGMVSNTRILSVVNYCNNKFN